MTGVKQSSNSILFRRCPDCTKLCIYPHHRLLSHRFETGRIIWL